MNGSKIRCPAFCVKKDKYGKLTIPGFIEEVEQETPTGRLFCTTQGCPFAFRDEHNKDQWIENADLLKLPTEDPIL